MTSSGTLRLVHDHVCQPRKRQQELLATLGYAGGARPHSESLAELTSRRVAETPCASTVTDPSLVRSAQDLHALRLSGEGGGTERRASTTGTPSSYYYLLHLES